jgi:8-oxo-dGTP pyrophosphatase MutT (NUDIX family)
MKKRGFGMGKWNGFGGKVNANETTLEAAKRELKEEADIDATDLSEMGIIEFEFKGNPEILEVHIFKGDAYTGVPKEGEEMKPEWFKIEEIPFDKMWPDDRYWFPMLLDNKKFEGKFVFGDRGEILEYKLSEVPSIA